MILIVSGTCIDHRLFSSVDPECFWLKIGLHHTDQMNASSSGAMLGLFVRGIHACLRFFVCFIQIEQRGETVVVVQFKEGLHYPANDSLQTVLDEEALLVGTPKSVILDMKFLNGIDFSITEVEQRSHSTGSGAWPDAWLSF